jgi:hypothetical protein
MMIDSVEDADGNIYLLDSQLGHVDVFAPDGEHLRTISGQGDGPGEVRRPQSLTFMPDGSLGIIELFPAHFVVLAPDGTPRASPVWGGEGSPQTGASVGLRGFYRGGTMIVSAQHSKAPVDGRQERTQYLAGLSDTGKEIVRYREAQMAVDYTNPRFVEEDLLPCFLIANTVGPDGRVYVPRTRRDYAIEVYEPDGTFDYVIEREFADRQRSDDEIRRLNALVDAWVADFPGEIPRELDEIEPAVTEMHVDDEGVLWVQHSRSGMDQPDGVLFSYDTFGPDGVWLREVQVVADGNPSYDGIRFLGGDRALLIRGYALARWASRGAQNADFGEDEVPAMEVIYCRAVQQ